MSTAHVSYVIEQNDVGEWYWVLKAHSFAIARSSQSFATEAQTREEIQYVKHYAMDAEIHGKFGDACRVH